MASQLRCKRCGGNMRPKHSMRIWRCPDCEYIEFVEYEVDDADEEIIVKRLRELGYME